MPDKLPRASRRDRSKLRAEAFWRMYRALRGSYGRVRSAQVAWRLSKRLHVYDEAAAERDHQMWG